MFYITSTGNTPCHRAVYGLVANDVVEISACTLPFVGVYKLEKREADEAVSLLLEVIGEDRVGEEKLEIRVKQSPVCGGGAVRGPTRRKTAGMSDLQQRVSPNLGKPVVSGMVVAEDQVEDRNRDD